MISKFNPCYRKSSNPNENFYVKIVSDFPYFIYVYLTYTINEKRFSKQSPVFRRGEFQLLTFPSDALNVALTIYNCRYSPPRYIYITPVPRNTSTCYKVSKNELGEVTCIEIPC